MFNDISKSIFLMVITILLSSCASDNAYRQDERGRNSQEEISQSKKKESESTELYLMTSGLQEVFIDFDRAIDKVAERIAVDVQNNGWRRVCIYQFSGKFGKNDNYVEDELVKRIHVAVRQIKGVTLVNNPLSEAVLNKLNTSFSAIVKPNYKHLLSKFGEETSANVIISGTISSSEIFVTYSNTDSGLTTTGYAGLINLSDLWNKDCSRAAMLSAEAGKLFSTNHFDTEEKFRQAIKLCPDSASLYYNLGILLYNRNMSDKKFDEAISELETALKINPRYGKALNALAYLYANNKGKTATDKEYAKGLAKRAVEIDPQNKEFQNTLAEISR